MNGIFTRVQSFTKKCRRADGENDFEQCVAVCERVHIAKLLAGYGRRVNLLNVFRKD